MMMSMSATPLSVSSSVVLGTMSVVSSVTEFEIFIGVRVTFVMEIAEFMVIMIRMIRMVRVVVRVILNITMILMMTLGDGSNGDSRGLGVFVGITVSSRLESGKSLGKISKNVGDIGRLNSRSGDFYGLHGDYLSLLSSVAEGGSESESEKAEKDD
jgi:hypothetical protein